MSNVVVYGYGESEVFGIKKFFNLKILKTEFKEITLKKNFKKDIQKYHFKIKAVNG